MGSDLSLHRGNDLFRYHPDWCADRFWGDREFASLEPRTTVIWDEDGYFRPADFGIWRAAVEDPTGPFVELHAEDAKENLDRFRRMLDAMEADPDLWARYGH